MSLDSQLDPIKPSVYTKIAGSRIEVGVSIPTRILSMLQPDHYEQIVRSFGNELMDLVTSLEANDGTSAN